MYLFAPVIGAAIAAIIITAVRGVPERKELDAAQGGELPSGRGRGLTLAG